GGSGETDLPGDPAGHPRAHDRGRLLGAHHVEHPAGQTRLDQDVHEGQRGERGEVGGLEYHGAPRGHGRADLAGAHGQGEVPRRDQDARPHGLLGHHDPVLAVPGHGLITADPHGLLGEPPEELGGVRDLAPGLGERLAHFRGHDEGQFVLALHDQLIGSAEDLAALALRH
ncbi:hypothetical protein PCS70012_02358, partial [Streptococcus pneumoniae PCS70012]